MSYSNVYIVILAAGRGSRMGSSVPKVLVKLKGKPFISHLLAAIASSSISTTIVVGNQAQEVKDRLGDPYHYVLEEKLLGTAYAVHKTKEVLENKADTVIVLYGDHPLVTPQTINSLLMKHKEEKGSVTIATTTVPDFNDWRNAFLHFGRILRNELGDIEGIREYKDATPLEREIKEVNPAYFCFDARWLWSALPKIGNANSKGEYYLTDVIAIAKREGKHIASISIDPIEALGINTPEDLARIEILIK